LTIETKFQPQAAPILEALEARLVRIL